MNSKMPNLQRPPEIKLKKAVRRLSSLHEIIVCVLRSSAFVAGTVQHSRSFIESFCSVVSDLIDQSLAG
jgi:DNA-binding MurR/RpiR family transcriptional regulator